jgi:hypothetical protein
LSRILNNYLSTFIALKSVLVIIISLAGLLTRQVVRHPLKSGLFNFKIKIISKIIIISFKLIVLIIRRLASLYY